MPAMSAPVAFSSSSAAFFAGAKTAVTSVFMLVLAGTYIGIGALTHDFGLSSWWLAISTVLVWAAPAQVILITTGVTTARRFEIALAVTLSAVRLFPMVVALMPVLRGPTTRLRDLLLPTHFTAVSMWVESLRLLPTLELQWRIPFCNGMSAGYMATATSSDLSVSIWPPGCRRFLPAVFCSSTPMSFLMSTARNARMMLDELGLVLGLMIGPLLDNSRRQSRSDVDGSGRRHACLSRASHTRGYDMSTLLTELSALFLMVLVGYLPNEVWRVFGLVVARGLNEDSRSWSGRARLRLPS